MIACAARPSGSLVHWASSHLFPPLAAVGSGPASPLLFGSAAATSQPHSGCFPRSAQHAPPASKLQPLRHCFSAAKLPLLSRTAAASLAVRSMRHRRLNSNRFATASRQQSCHFSAAQRLLPSQCAAAASREAHSASIRARRFPLLKSEDTFFSLAESVFHICYARRRRIVRQGRLAPAMAQDGRRIAGRDFRILCVQG